MNHEHEMRMIQVRIEKDNKEFKNELKMVLGLIGMGIAMIISVIFIF